MSSGFQCAVRCVAVAATLLSLSVVSGAGAAVQVAGTGEPAFTKSNDNTVWFSYASPGLSPGDNYGLMMIVGKDGATKAPKYFLNLGYAASGTTWFNMTGEYPIPLAEGSAYGGCVSGQVFYSYLGAWTPEIGTTSCQDAGIRGLGTVSTIDRSAPQIAVSVNGAAQFANAGPLNVAINYNDAISPPWANSTAGLEFPRFGGQGLVRRRVPLLAY